MSATQRRASATDEAVPRRRLNVDLFDARAARFGATTIDQRADLVGVDRATLFRWRNGQTTPSVDDAMRIAEQFGVPVDKLWPRERVTA